MIKLSDELHIPTMAEVIRDRERQRPAKPHRRSYAAARISRTNADWTTSPAAVNPTLRRDLAILRARAREMARNAPHFDKFLRMARTNVIGPGIQMQCRAVSDKGRPKTRVNQMVETEFWRWGHRETCTLSGRLDWLGVQNLFITHLIRDGEALIQHINDPSNVYGYSLKIWNVDWLDETHNEVLKNGNRIVMGVEVDALDRPAAYHLTTPTSETTLDSGRPRTRRRIPADEMTHAFMAFDDECQVRGVTWFASGMLQGKHFHEYTTHVVEQARVGAATLGFLERDETDETEFIGTEDENGNVAPVSIDVSPLSMNELPPGYKLNQFDPKQPTQNHAQFSDTMLKTVAAAVGVCGFSLSGDMSQVNYSSARVGLGEEREIWRALQQFVITNLCRDVYRRWLKSAWLSGAIDVRENDYRALMEPDFKARAWRYVDPQKEINAQVAALESGLTSYTSVMSELGIDLADHLAEIKAERDLMAETGVILAPAASGGASAQPADPGDWPPAPEPNAMPAEA